jgi:hypothetical protein
MYKDSLIVAIYAGFQENLRAVGLVDDRGYPENTKTLVDKDSLAVYKYFAEKLPSVKGDFIELGEKYNLAVRKLHDEYTLNNYALVVKLSEEFVLEYGTHVDSVVVLPKINRILRFMKTQVSRDVLIESTQAAGNMYRLMTGRPELTKKVRNANKDKWKSAAKSAQKVST